MGVILFILVKGIFPFKEARVEEYFYSLLLTGQYDLYFEKVNASHLSPEFKDLVIKLFSYDPDKRPTLQEVKQHPWMNPAGFDPEQIRHQIKQSTAAQAKPELPQRPVKVKRTSPHAQ